MSFEGVGSSGPKPKESKARIVVEERRWIETNHSSQLRRGKTDVFLKFHIISRICLSISICVVRSALDEGAYFGMNGGIGSRVELNLLPTPHLCVGRCEVHEAAMDKGQPKSR